MHLKSLSLRGFKSFSEKTTLVFEPGITVVVGPNGSGKSNIVDAISWVLGQQGPRALRSGKMEDVIFSGTRNRPALGMAEVLLCIDNTDSALATEYSEVTIGRRLFRSGESEYRLNGAECRLLDIQELLSDAAIGRSQHTVVGQGELDEVAGSDPERLRLFIEDAAGVAKHRRRKESALRKIAATEGNVARLADLLSEVRRQLKPLREQARVAGHHENLKLELSRVRLIIASREISALKQSLDALGADPQAYLQQIEREATALDGELEQAEARRQGQFRKTEAFRHASWRLDRSAERASALARLASERARSCEAQLQSETQESIRARIDEARRELGRLSQDLDMSQEATRHGAQAEHDCAERLEREQHVVSDARRAAEQAAASRRKLEAAVSSAHATISSLREARREARAEANRAGQKGEELQARRLRAQQDIEAASRDVEALEVQAAPLSRKLDDAEEGLSRLEAEQRAGRTMELDTYRRLGRAQGRLEIVEEIKNFRAGSALVAGGRSFDLDSLERLARAELLQVAGDVSSVDSAAKTARDELQVLGGLRDGLTKDLLGIDARVSAGADKLASAERELHACTRELEAQQALVAPLQERMQGIEQRLSDAEKDLPELQRQAAAVSEAEMNAQGMLEQRSKSAEDAAALLAEARVAAARANERSALLLERKAAVEQVLAETASRLGSLAGRKDQLRTMIAGARFVAEAAGLIGQCATQSASEAGELHERAGRALQTADEEVESLRVRRAAKSRDVEEARTRSREEDITRSEMRFNLRALKDRVAQEWGDESDSLTERFATLMVAPRDDRDDRDDFERLAAGSDEVLGRRGQRLEKELHAIGAVNALAASELKALEEREVFLAEQLSDLKETKRNLMKVVGEVDTRMQELFLQAFEDVAREFEVVFSHLFPGGSGRLRLSAPGEPLESGVELDAKPAGKNVRRLSLLSGGERSLVALGFLFAVFRSRPSAFYVLDEVEAALDDVNLQRFLRLIDVFRGVAQVLIVSHQKRTMEVADVLYGVSMGADASSKVISQRLAEHSPVASA